MSSSLQHLSTRDGVKLAYDKAGDGGPVIVLIHGTIDDNRTGPGQTFAEHGCAQAGVAVGYILTTIFRSGVQHSVPGTTVAAVSGCVISRRLASILRSTDMMLVFMGTLIDQHGWGFSTLNICLHVGWS